MVSFSNHLSEEKMPKLIIVMGVSGSGKTTIANRLSKINVLEFMEADEFHSKLEIEKMSKGI